MEVQIKKLAQKIKIKSPDLLTRPVGRAMYGEVSSLLTIIDEGEVVILDFNGIKVIDSSFIDEFVIRLLKDAGGEKKKFHIKLRNFSNIIEINIASVLRSYSEFNDKKMVVMTEDICLNNNFFIGELNDLEIDIINYFRVNKTATEQDIRTLTGLPVEKMDSALKHLIDLRIIRSNGLSSYSGL